MKLCRRLRDLLTVRSAALAVPRVSSLCPMTQSRNLRYFLHVLCGWLVALYFGDKGALPHRCILEAWCGVGRGMGGGHGWRRTQLASRDRGGEGPVVSLWPVHQAVVRCWWELEAASGVRKLVSTQDTPYYVCDLVQSTVSLRASLNICRMWK